MKNQCFITKCFICCILLFIVSCSKKSINSPESPYEDTEYKDTETAIDLGLSVKWADRNVGAIRPEVYGGYFAWGEIEKKSEYSWFTYDFANDNNGYKFYKYNTNSSYGYVDSLVILEKQDDVASVTLGGKWRIPTADEWQELIDLCKWEWDTINGVDGLRVTSSNGNSIFLPAAGHKYDGMRYYSEGSYCDYWSSSLNASYPREACGIRNGYIHNDYRYNGFSIRAVCNR